MGKRRHKNVKDYSIRSKQRFVRGLRDTHDSSSDDENDANVVECVPAPSRQAPARPPPIPIQNPAPVAPVAGQQDPGHLQLPECVPECVPAPVPQAPARPAPIQNPAPVAPVPGPNPHHLQLPANPEGNIDSSDTSSSSSATENSDDPDSDGCGDDGSHTDDSSSICENGSGIVDCESYAGESYDGGDYSDDPSSDSSGASSSSDDDDDPTDSDEDPDDEDPEDPNDDNPPLFEGAPISLSESLLSVLSLGLAHNLSGACLADILELIAMHCPQPNLCQTSLYKFKKFFSALKSPVVRRFYCSVCLNYLENKDEVCGRCHAQRGVGQFLEMPIIPQLQALYKRPGFYEKVQNHRERRKQVNDNFEDLYDGDVYVDLHNNGNIVGNGDNISFTWNTDGVRIFRSSKSELWPFYLSVNELAYSDRTKIENTIIAGLWYGPKKPLPGLFLRFIRDELSQVRRGINVTLPNGNQVLRVRGAVICGTCDLHAKALFLNTKLYNSRFGCAVCKIETVPLVPGGLHRVYPYRRLLHLRTDVETVIYAQDARQRGADVFGIKGPSALTPFVRRPIEFTSCDIMHLGWLGQTKRLCLIWFNKKYRMHRASMHGILNLIDERLVSVCPPHYMQRLPRSIAEHFKFWKAHDLKAFLLVYSLPLLADIMPNEYFDHHKLLVFGISILNMDSISPGMIEQASRALNEYVARFEDLYGLEHMTNNLHTLLHLPLMTEKFGPLWTTNCANYENLNGILKRLVSGTRYADQQIYTAASIFLNLSAFRQEKLPVGRKPHEFCKRLAECKKKLPLTAISDKLAVVGKYYHANALPVIVQDALAPLGIQDGTYHLFRRLFNYRKKILFTSVSYTRITKTNSTCVKYDSHGRKRFGIINSFVRVTHCACAGVCNNCDTSFYAIMREVTVTSAFRAEPGGNIPQIQRVTYRDEHFPVEVDRLIDVCCLIHNGGLDRTYIIERTNSVERE